MGIMRMTLRDTFIDLDVVMNLMLWVKSFNGELPVPTIIKPKPLWTGKQIISMIIPDVNLKRFYGSKDKLGHKNWHDKTDSNILIRQGELIAGILTK